jgi:nucleoside-diphosphate-sugar epimerase
MKGAPAKITVDKRRLRPYDVTRLVCDSAKLVKLTGWKTETSLRDGLKKTVDWYKANGNVWEWERRYSS